MSEVSFARTFLATLDSRPTKILPTHYEDPRTYPARPAYTLPKLPTPKRKRVAPKSSSPPQSLTVTLVSSRNPPLDVTLANQVPTTSILELKTLLSEEASIPVAKLKLLFNKKPLGDTKTIAEIAGLGMGDKVEFGVMVLGGAASVQKRIEEEVRSEVPHVSDRKLEEDEKRADRMEGVERVTNVAQGPSGREVVETVEFWDDLKGFLLQRLRDEAEGEKMFSIFRRAYDNKE